MSAGSGTDHLLSRHKVIKVTFVITLLASVSSILILYGATSNGVFAAAQLPTFATISKTKLIVYDTIPNLNESPSETSIIKVPKGSDDSSKVTSNRSYGGFKDMPDPCATHRRNNGIEDLLCMKPLEFLPNYKNPCWLDDGVLRCLPYFHLFGVCKAGTSDLFRRLYLHPDIVPNNGIMQKETWFWSFRRYTTKKIGNVTEYKTIKDFADNFNASEIHATADSAGDHHKITGHGDPMDLWDRFKDVRIPQNEPGAKELTWTSAFLVRKVNPNVKLLLMLRDPIERLYSIYFHLQLGKTSAEFHADVVEGISLWKNCLQNNSMRHCIYNKLLKMKLKVPFYSSFYTFHLKEWLRAFPREQMLIMRYEDYVKDIKGTLKQIFTFLNIANPNATLLEEMGTMKHFYQTELKLKAGPMLNTTLGLLRDLYMEQTRELAELLQDERYEFKDVSFS